MNTRRCRHGFMLIGDSGLTGDNRWVKEDCRPIDWQTLHYWSWSQLSGPHGEEGGDSDEDTGQLNCGFLDGHVELLSHTLAEPYDKRYLRWINRYPNEP